MLNQKGFSLIEVIVVVTLLTLVGLGLSTLLLDSLKTQKNIEQRGDVKNNLDELRAIVGNPQACRNTFFNKKPSDDVISIVKDSSNKKWLQIKEELYGNIQVENMYLTDFTPDTIDPKKGITVFTVQYKATMKATGPQVMHRTFPLRVQLNAADRIEKCVALYGTHDQNFQYKVDGSIFYNGGNVGIGTSEAATKLDLDGAVKVADDTQNCRPRIAGAFKYEPSSKLFWVCNGKDWLEVVTRDPYHWVNAVDSHAATCASTGTKVATNQGYGVCASGEKQPLLGEGIAKIAYKYGTWGGAGKGGDQIVGNYCYDPGQKRDNDGTDLIVAYLCKR